MYLWNIKDGTKKELIPEYDPRGSFGGKAHVMRNGNRITLFSYGLPVCYLKTGDPAHIGEIYRTSEAQPESNTTARHMREFIQQAGKARPTMAELRALPTE